MPDRQPRSAPIHSNDSLNQTVDNSAALFILFNRLVEQRADGLDAVFHALADPTRRSMLRRLAEGEFTIGELAAPFRMSFAGASKHVRTLERAGLVRRTVQGRTHRCRLDPESMAEAFEWMRFYERFWPAHLAALERELRKAEREHQRRRKS